MHLKRISKSCCLVAGMEAFLLAVTQACVKMIQAWHDSFASCGCDDVVMWWWKTWWLVWMQHDATCILMKRLVREQRIKTIRSEEQDKDSLAREKLELLLSGTQTLFDPSSRLRCDRKDLQYSFATLPHSLISDCYGSRSSCQTFSLIAFNMWPKWSKLNIICRIEIKTFFEGSNASKCSRM